MIFHESNLFDAETTSPMSQVGEVILNQRLLRIVKAKDKMYFFRPDENKNLTYTEHEPTIAPARNSELRTKLATRVVDSYSSKARQRLSLRTMHKFPTIRQETTTSDINFPNLCQHTGGAEVCCELSMPISERA